MLRRKIEKQLLEWKNNSKKVCLLVNGARQVGKTYIIDKFARENYQYYTYINFIENLEYKEIFEGNLNVDNLIKQISIRVEGAQLEPYKTIIFLDEIQMCPNARTALKFFAIDKRFDVIASGSLLGIKYKEVVSFPVGYVEYLNMYSLDFEEFLWASGISDASVNDLREYYNTQQTVPMAIHKRMMELFREYIIVGGMPKVVSEFIDTKDFSKVLRLQRAILAGYKEDIAKYADGSEKVKARACFDSIPKQLAKAYKKFQYSVVEHKSTAKKYADSIKWLEDAGIVNVCYNLSCIELPLEGNAKSDCFKVYMADTGLLMAMLEDGAQEDIIDGNLGIYKGAIYENIIADIFTKSGKKLYYYERDSKLEIDFVIRYRRKAVPVEVKSADNTKAKSLASLLDNDLISLAIKLSSKNLGSTDTILSYPLYLSFLL